MNLYPVTPSGWIQAKWAGFRLGGWKGWFRRVSNISMSCSLTTWTSLYSSWMIWTHISMDPAHRLVDYTDLEYTKCHWTSFETLEQSHLCAVGLYPGSLEQQRSKFTPLAPEC